MFPVLLDKRMAERAIHEASMRSAHNHQLELAANIETVQYLFSDYQALQYLHHEDLCQCLEKNLEIPGFEIYFVEQWACERKILTVITSFTGNMYHTMKARVLKVPKDRNLWSDKLKRYFSELMNCHARPKETKDGILFVTNLSSFPSNLNLVAVTSGDAANAWEVFLLNINLRRMNCAGRSALLLSAPSSTSENKFQQLYRVSTKIPINYSVRQLVFLIQVALFYFDLLTPNYIDGLLCDKTIEAIKKWWIQIGGPHLHFPIKPNQNAFSPATVSAVIGMVLSARIRLSASGIYAPKDCFEVDQMIFTIGQYQRQLGLRKSMKLDHETMEKLFLPAKKGSQHEILRFGKVVKNRVQDISGKTSQNPSDTETVDIEKMIKHIHGSSLIYLWNGKGSSPNPTFNIDSFLRALNQQTHNKIPSTNTIPLVQNTNNPTPDTSMNNQPRASTSSTVGSSSLNYKSVIKSVSNQKSKTDDAIKYSMGKIKGLHSRKPTLIDSNILNPTTTTTTTTTTINNNNNIIKTVNSNENGSVNDDNTNNENNISNNNSNSNLLTKSPSTESNNSNPSHLYGLANSSNLLPSKIPSYDSEYSHSNGTSGNSDVSEIRALLTNNSSTSHHKSRRERAVRKLKRGRPHRRDRKNEMRLDHEYSATSESEIDGNGYETDNDLRRGYYTERQRNFTHINKNKNFKEKDPWKQQFRSELKRRNSFPSISSSSCLLLTNLPEQERLSNRRRVSFSIIDEAVLYYPAQGLITPITISNEINEIENLGKQYSLDAINFDNVFHNYNSMVQYSISESDRLNLELNKLNELRNEKTQESKLLELKSKEVNAIGLRLQYELRSLTRRVRDVEDCVEEFVSKVEYLEDAISKYCDIEDTSHNLQLDKDKIKEQENQLEDKKKSSIITLTKSTDNDENLLQDSEENGDQKMKDKDETSIIQSYYDYILSKLNYFRGEQRITSYNTKID